MIKSGASPPAREDPIRKEMRAQEGGLYRSTEGLTRTTLEVGVGQPQRAGTQEHSPLGKAARNSMRFRLLVGSGHRSRPM